MGEVMSQIEELPQWLQWWLRWMQIVLIAMPLVFVRRREAQILLAAQAGNFAVGFAVLAWEDGAVTKLFGLGHVFWALAFGVIAHRWLRGRIALAGRPVYRAWLAVAMTTLAISLPLDAYDLLVYASGTRMPLTEYYGVTG